MKLQFRRLVRQLLPPFVIDVLRKDFRRPVHMAGVFDSFDELDLPAGQGFATAESCRWAIKKAKQSDIDDYWGRPVPQPGDAYFCSLVNFHLDEGRHVEIIDYGGGAGNTYFATKRFIHGTDFRWTVIEQEGLVRAIGETFSDDVRLRFMTEFPKSDGSVKIVLFRAAIQYFPEPFEAIGEMGDVDHMIFVRLPAGDVPDFLTVQNFQNRSEAPQPFRIFNRDRFIERLENLGYRWQYGCSDREVLEMDNFPETHRLTNTITLAFRRADTLGRQ